MKHLSLRTRPLLRVTGGEMLVWGYSPFPDHDEWGGGRGSIIWGIQKIWGQTPAMLYQPTGPRKCHNRSRKGKWFGQGHTVSWGKTLDWFTGLPAKDSFISLLSFPSLSRKSRRSFLWGGGGSVPHLWDPCESLPHHWLFMTCKAELQWPQRMYAFLPTREREDVRSFHSSLPSKKSKRQIPPAVTFERANAYAPVPGAETWLVPGQWSPTPDLAGKAVAESPGESPSNCDSPGLSFIHWIKISWGQCLASVLLKVFQGAFWDKTAFEEHLCITTLAHLSHGSLFF